MQKVVMGVQVDNRFDDAVKLQEIFTDYGCIIKTRLGLHQAIEDDCDEKGLIILELAANCGLKYEELEKELQGVKGVKVNKMIF